MTDRTIEQALFRGSELLGQSPGHSDTIWLLQPMIEMMQPTAADGDSIYVHQLTKDLVAVVQTHGTWSRVLVVPGPLYRLIHDPFRLTREFPPEFTPNSRLAELPWIHGRPAPRELSAVQKVLREGDGPTLLGAAQALVDGGRIAFQRSQPDPDLFEQIWMLLPDSVRGELSFATFTRNNALQFDLLATPIVNPDDHPRYLTERHAGDYPEGRYELALQMAVESEDEGRMRELFARRSGSQAMRLAWTMLLAAIGLGVAVRFIPWEKLR